MVGGVAGGLLGSSFGRGNGRVAAAAGGAVIGAMAGGSVQTTGNAPRYQTVRRCSNEGNASITGYRVVYEFNGQHRSYIARTEPGEFIRLRVTVTPMD